MSAARPSTDNGRALDALAAARVRARANATTVLDELLVSMTPHAARALAASAGVEIVIGPDTMADAHAIEGLRSTVLLGVRRDGRHCLLMGDPWDETLVAAAVARSGRYVEPAAADAALLARWSAAPTAPPGLASPADAAGGSSMAPLAPGVVQFVDEAITSAYLDGASDVHFECDRQGVSVKFRLDGVLTPVGRLQGRELAEEVISRIKVLAQLDITERRLPQDGRFRFSSKTASLDLRVSVMPSIFGEDAVLRLLDKSQLRSAEQQVSLDALGFEPAHAKAIRWLAGLPNGMLLVTGPTGSGKTTTVYSVLSEINSGTEKIVTIEDPVEYELPGVLQIPVNERKGLTFARGLRSILRHDPDRILVGEIRDAETAEIAVQSSLTGHLVFTTVHANSIFDVIGRFRHFGIDMFGFVSSLNGVVVQRLVRRLCPACAGTRRATEDEARWLGAHAEAGLADELPAVAGCDACRHTGYRGRMVISEVHRITDALRSLVLRQADVTEIRQLAYGGEVKPLVRQALERVRRRETSLEEVFRVVGQV